MCRIKGIAEILKWLAVIPLLTLIQPDGEQCQQREALLGKEKIPAQERKLIAHSTHHFYIDVPQADQLPNIVPPLAPPQEVEREHCENTAVMVIHKGEDSCNAGRKKGGKSYNDLFKKVSGLSGFFVPVHQQQGNKECPQHILMDGIKNTAADGKVEGELRNSRKQEKP